MNHHPTLILQGVFRSGTTTLFRTLRRDQEVRCYYEPLHPDLLDHAGEADSQVPTHQKSPLYAEYTSLPRSLRTHFDPSFSRSTAVLDADVEAPNLKNYLDLLVESSSSAALQFNRAFWMPDWLNAAFPHSRFVHLVRDPRSVVWSQFTTSSGRRVRMDWPLLSRQYVKTSSGNLENVFSSYAYYGAYHVNEYLEVGRQSLGHALDDDVATRAGDSLRAVRDAPPYVQALALWGAQVRVCHHHAKKAYGDRYLRLRYEDLCQETRPTLLSLYQHSNRPLPNAVKAYGDEHLHARRLATWRSIEEADEHFRDGIHQAGIADLMQEFGYPIG